MDIQGRTRARNTKIFEVKATNIFANFSNEAVIMQYGGKPLLMKNFTADCVRGIASAADNHIEAECSEPEYRDPDLKIWHQTKVSNMSSEVKHSRMELAYPKIIVYCYGNSIIMRRKESPRNITDVCPKYSFALDMTTNFSTSDGRVDHIGGDKLRIDSLTEINVADYHLDYDLLDREIDSSIGKISELTNRRSSYYVAGNKVEWHVAAIAGWSLCTFSLIGVLGLAVWHRRRILKMMKRRGNQEPARSPRVLEESVRRGTERAIRAVVRDNDRRRQRHGVSHEMVSSNSSVA